VTDAASLSAITAFAWRMPSNAWVFERPRVVETAGCGDPGQSWRRNRPWTVVDTDAMATTAAPASIPQQGGSGAAWPIPSALTPFLGLSRVGDSELAQPGECAMPVELPDFRGPGWCVPALRTGFVRCGRGLVPADGVRVAPARDDDRGKAVRRCHRLAGGARLRAGSRGFPAPDTVRLGSST
jgi:hypothetical protein